MRFSVLGQLEILDDTGTPLALTSPKPRLLLAVLLARRAPVPVDELLDMLWDGRPPASARTNLQGFVHRLRRLIGAHRIGHDHAGYEMRAAPGEMDHAELERLIHEGRCALEAGDAERAADRCRRALDLWRGPTAFADVTQIDTIHLEAVRLGEVRLAGTELWIDAQMRLDRHESIIPQLLALVDQHPMRQRLTLQLMLALYRAGRAAQALDAYRRAHATIAEELGLEPSPQLSELYQAILTGGPIPGPPRVTAGHGLATEAPAELPPADPSFTGRHHERRHITSLLTADGGGVQRPIVAVSGPGGIGKSALAVEVAHGVARHYPDGQLYINLRGATPGADPVEPHAAINQLLRSLGIEHHRIPERAENAAELFRATLSNRRVVVLLDDARDAEQVRLLDPGPGSCSVVIITSRHVIADLDPSQHITLGTLTDTEALLLLSHLAGTERTAREPEAAAEIAALCGNLPLAVKVAGARLLSRPDWKVSSLRDRLTNAHRRLDELAHDDLAVRTSCEVAYAALTEHAVDLFDLLGLIDFHDISVDVAAALTGRTVDDVRASLSELAQAGLLAETPSGRFSLHDLIRLFARERSGRIESGTAADAVRRVLRHFLATARNAARTSVTWTERRSAIGPATEELTSQGIELPDGAAIATWIRAEAANIASAAQQATVLPVDGPAILAGLAVAMAQPLRHQDRWGDIISMCRLALDAVSNPIWRSSLHAAIGDARHMLGHLTEARNHAQLAVEEARAAGDRRAESDALSLLSVIVQDMDGAEQSLAFHHQALAIQRELDDTRGQAHVLTNLGVGYHLAGRLDEAIAAHEEALTLDDNLHLKAIALFRLGDAELDSQRPGRALARLEKAAEIFRSCGSSTDEALALWLCGNILDALNRRSEADGRRRHSLDVLCEMRAITRAEADGVLQVSNPPMPAPLRRGRASRTVARPDRLSRRHPHRGDL